MNNRDKAIAFSNGEFEKITDYIAEDATWIVVEENTFKGKHAIVNNCEQVGNYFKSVSTKFKTHLVIEENKTVAINGTAEFSKNGEVISFVSSCDLYEFNEMNKIEKITSYCIQQDKSK